MKSAYNFGLPYHGLVKNAELTLPNKTKKTYLGLINGDTQFIGIPNLPSAIRTLDEMLLDLAHGFEWRNYALITDGKLGHFDLNDPLYQWIIYIDDNKVPWHLRFGLTLPNFQTANMWCEIVRPFGRIAKEHPISQMPSLVSKSSTINGAFLHANRFSLERNSRGSEVLIHLYASATNSPGINKVIDFPTNDDFKNSWGLFEVWKLKITGIGLLTEDTTRLGEGITASLEKYLSFNDIQRNEVKNIKKHEIVNNVNHVSFEEKQIGNVPFPPNCQGTDVTFLEKWTHGLTDLETVSKGGYFFPSENIIHRTFDWNGLETYSTNIVRLLFDSDDKEYKVAVRKGNQSLSRREVRIDGFGEQIIKNVTFKLDSGVCKHQPALYDRTLNLTTTINQQSKVAEITEILVNDKVSQKLHLIEMRTNTEIKNRIIYESGVYDPSSFVPFLTDIYEDNTDSQLTSTITITSNDEILRSFTGIAKDIPVSPFFGSLPEDNPTGVYEHLSFGFIANNLFGIAKIKYLNKEHLNTPTFKTIQGLSVPDVFTVPYEWNSSQIYGSFEPKLKLQSINFIYKVGWV